MSGSADEKGRQWLAGHLPTEPRAPTAQLPAWQPAAQRARMRLTASACPRPCPPAHAQQPHDVWTSGVQCNAKDDPSQTRQDTCPGNPHARALRQSFQGSDEPGQSKRHRKKDRIDDEIGPVVDSSAVAHSVLLLPGCGMSMPRLSTGQRGHSSSPAASGDRPACAQQTGILSRGRVSNPPLLPNGHQRQIHCLS